MPSGFPWGKRKKGIFFWGWWSLKGNPTPEKGKHKNKGAESTRQLELGLTRTVERTRGLPKHWAAGRDCGPSPSNQTHPDSASAGTGPPPRSRRCLLGSAQGEVGEVEHGEGHAPGARGLLVLLRLIFTSRSSHEISVFPQRKAERGLGSVGLDRLRSRKDKLKPNGAAPTPKGNSMCVLP